MQDKPSKHITGFRKSHGTQHSLMTMPEKWKSAVHKGLKAYSQVSNRRGVWNSRGGWKKYRKLTVSGVGKIWKI